MVKTPPSYIINHHILISVTSLASSPYSPVVLFFCRSRQTQYDLKHFNVNRVGFEQLLSFYSCPFRWVIKFIFGSWLRSWVQLPPGSLFLLYNYGIALSLILTIVG